MGGVAALQQPYLVRRAEDHPFRPLCADAGPDGLSPVPANLPDVHRVGEDQADGAAVEAAAPAAPPAHGIDRLLDAGAAAAPGVQAEDVPHALGLLRDDLQRGEPSGAGLAVAEGGRGEIRSVLNGLKRPAAQALGDHPIFAAGEKRLHLRSLLIQLRRQIIGPLRRDDERPALLQRVENEALIVHPAAAQTLHIHAQHRVVPSGPGGFQQPQHLGPGEQALAGDDLLVNVRDRQALTPGKGRQRRAVLGKRLLQTAVLLRPGFAQIHGADDGAFSMGGFFQCLPCRIRSPRSSGSRRGIGALCGA